MLLLTRFRYFLGISKCERSFENWGPVSWCSQILGATSIENTTGSDPLWPAQCILLCLLWARETECRGGPISWCSCQKTTRRDPTHEPQEDHETGPQYSQDLSHLLKVGKYKWLRDNWPSKWDRSSLETPMPSALLELFWNT